MIFARAESVCPVCLRVLPARKRSEPDGIYMDKTCPEHGNFSSLIWEGDLRSYLTWPVRNAAAEAPVDGKARDRGCPYDCGLCREHRTKGCCVLLELTRRCNLHCPVCFASAGAGAESDLSLAEIETQYDYLMAHGGPFNIQLSGGEPTVRDDLPAIIRLGREKGFPFFQLNTNGLRLAMEAGYAEELKAAGLNTVFLQFDGVTDAVFETLRGRPLLAEKEQAIVNCAAAGLGIVLVPVIAGVSYEFIRLAGRYDNKLVDILSAPGLCLQRLTTREPDDSQIEVGIASVEAVFNWKKYLNENFGASYPLEEEAQQEAQE